MAVASLLVACTSTPVRYYTLLPAAAADPPAVAAAAYQLKIAPIRVPAQVDRFELVVRRGDGGITVADGERWIAPLADELRTALELELARELQPALAAESTSQTTLLLSLNVERFESAPSHYALIEATWSLRLRNAGEQEVLACRSYAYQTVANGYAALVEGHQRAVVSIADAIAAGASRLAGSGVLACPTR
jgi:uncharacterized protein